MGTLSLTVAVSLFLVGSDDNGKGEVSAEQFLRLVRSQQDAIRDLAFAFEGDRRYVGPPDPRAIPLTSYQGRYALRSDGAIFLEHYFEIVDDRTGHPVKTMVGGKGEMAQVTSAFVADPDPPIARSGAGPGSFFEAESPETFLFLWRYQTLKNVEDFGYRFVGWEVIDGHRCAHIEFDAHPGLPGRVLQELWVDLERGAHPLRIRNSDGEQTVYLIDQIGLNQVSLPDGEAVWFPVTGRYQEFFFEGNYTKNAAYQITTYVLDGTLILNQGLSDEVFHVKGMPFRPTFQTKRPAKPGRVTVKKPGFDLVDAEKKLDAALADPARRATAPDASASLRAEMSSSSVIAWGVGGLGVAALIAAAIVALRRR